MGDMADMYDYEMPDTAADFMALCDAELVRMTEEACSDKIKSIRQASLDGRPLSKKQRWCLAFWIAGEK